MNRKQLDAYIKENSRTLDELAGCGSVSELMIRLAVLGRNWSSWNWAVFMFFLWRGHIGRVAGSFKPPESGDMFTDIVATIDDGSELDCVFRDRVVVLSMIDLLDEEISSVDKGLLCVLAHVFAKFPDMWNVSWMFARHSKPVNGRLRTHRLAKTLPAAVNRPASYFESPAFLNDFIHRYWSASMLTARGITESLAFTV